MKRGQVSVEYAIVFVGVLILFVAVASITPSFIRDASKSSDEAMSFLKKVKLHTVAAATSSEEYEVRLPIPSQFAGRSAQFNIYDSRSTSGLPDSAEFIDPSTLKLLARVDLPTVQSINTAGIDGIIVIRRSATGVTVEI